MKGLIRRLLGLFGLVPSGDLDRALGEARQAADRIRSLEGRIAKIRADAENWKARHEDAAAKLARCRTELVESQAEVERTRAGVEHAKARAQEWKTRATALADEKAILRARAEEAQDVAIAAREYLMATETKLDMIEAAIQVLDTRSRDAAVGSS
jgi:chromosome segregation ATPase